jgi:putative hydrolase of the HAD superfamily
MRTKAVIFDFGGTLFTYDQAITRRRGRARLLAEWLGLPQDDMAPIVHAVREGMARSAGIHMKRPFYMHSDMFADSGRFAAEILGRTMTDAQAEEWALLVGGASTDGIEPRPGTHETLRELRRRGVHVGAASNADEREFYAMVDSLQVRDLFDSLLCSETARSCKPDQGIFRIALERAGCAPHEAIFVGDTPDADIVGAELAGMRPILIEETSALAFDRGAVKPGTVVIKALAELLVHL